MDVVFGVGFLYSMFVKLMVGEFYFVEFFENFLRNVVVILMKISKKCDDVS